MRTDLIQLLRQHGIRPSAQRVAIAEVVLAPEDHPGADQVLAAVQSRMPVVSRATVYNTLRVLVEKGLLRELVLADGKRIYDPKVERHHHFVDDRTGAVQDVPWEALEVARID